MDLDLDKMNLSELRELRGNVDRYIKDFESRKRKEALSAAEEAAREFGFQLSELTGAKRARRGAAVAKYAHPDDANKTWSGRGRRPAWIKEHLANGGDLADFEI